MAEEPLSCPKCGHKGLEAPLTTSGRTSVASLAPVRCTSCGHVMSGQQFEEALSKRAADKLQEGPIPSSDTSGQHQPGQGPAANSSASSASDRAKLE